MAALTEDLSDGLDEIAHLLRWRYYRSLRRCCTPRETRQIIMEEVPTGDI